MIGWRFVYNVCICLFFNVLRASMVQSTTKCDNGEMISSVLFCNGAKDCRDGSDETAQACLYVRCPGYAFQCAYGACINGNSECDGVQNCADNSDETTERCYDSAARSNTIQNCSKDQFECKSGECIDDIYKCDGMQHCHDASDETVDLCSALQCPGFAFRCGYGACVRGNAYCDGIVDCFDASDESLQICKKYHAVFVPTTPKPSTTTTEEIIVIPATHCLLEEIPNMKYIHLWENCENDSMDCAAIRYECSAKYLLHGFETNFCSNGRWTNPHPKCITVVSSASVPASFTNECKDGQVISLDQFCDGKKDCRDGSDETVLACLHIRCPSFAFQCTYGACVNGNSECDGKQDCADNSDETTIRCNGVLETLTINGNCSEDEFQCKSGQCIQEYYACDGKQHCNDASDETVDLCSAFYCPEFAFRCGYGACVGGDSRCDGIADCLDSSDESLRICGNSHKFIETTTVSMGDTTTVRPPTTTTKRIIVTPESNCVLEDVPNLKYFGLLEENELQPGDNVDSIPILYKCPPKYILEGLSTNFCANGKWISALPKCSKYCSYLPILGITFDTICEYNGAEISCKQQLVPGTKAKFACHRGYRKPNRPVRDVIVCDKDGEWDYSPYRCEPICGIEPPPTAVQDIIPWNVAIYKKTRRGYDQICAGTIINAKIILSAAHCFRDEQRKMALDKDKFAVAVGKYYQSFDAFEPNRAQFLNISELYIPPDYTDSELFYQNDLAILVLNNFIAFTQYVRPICLEWTEFSQNRTSFGTVGSWGMPEDSGGRETKLRVMDLNVVDYKDCVARTEDEYRNLITNDKFCIDHHNGATVCETDSGGGFAVSRIVGGVNTYFLSGIISNGLTSKKQCGGDFCTTCTNIQVHANIIIEFETKYRPK